MSTSDYPLPLCGSEEAYRTRCSDLKSVVIDGKRFWLEAMFASIEDALAYIRDQRNEGYGYIHKSTEEARKRLRRYGSVECMLGGCSGNAAVWCRQTVETYEGKYIGPGHRRRMINKAIVPKPNRMIPYYWIAGQYVISQTWRQSDPGDYSNAEFHGCRETDRSKCPPPKVPIRLADRQLPEGVPDWAMGPLLTAGAIVIYLVARKLTR